MLPQIKVIKRYNTSNNRVNERTSPPLTALEQVDIMNPLKLLRLGMMRYIL